MGKEWIEVGDFWRCAICLEERDVDRMPKRMVSLKSNKICKSNVQWGIREVMIKSRIMHATVTIPESFYPNCLPHC